MRQRVISVRPDFDIKYYYILFARVLERNMINMMGLAFDALFPLLLFNNCQRTAHQLSSIEPFLKPHMSFTLALSHGGSGVCPADGCPCKNMRLKESIWYAASTNDVAMLQMRLKERPDLANLPVLKLTTTSLI